MSPNHMQRHQALIAILSGTLFIVSWLFYVRSASTFAVWAVILAHVALAFASHGIFSAVPNRKYKEQNSTLETLAIRLIIIGNLGIAGLNLMALYPVLGISMPLIAMSIIAVGSWIAFVLGYGFMGLSLLKERNGMGMVGISFLLTIAAALVVVIAPGWTIILSAITLGTICIGIGYIACGLALYVSANTVHVVFNFNSSESIVMQELTI